MIPTLIKIDVTKKPEKMPGHFFHNRYHPKIPAVVHVKPGDVFKIECYDWGGKQSILTSKCISSKYKEIN